MGELAHVVGTRGTHGHNVNEYFDTILIMLETIIVFPLEIIFQE